MKLTPDTWTVYNVDFEKTRIDPKPPYQRGPVWSQPAQQLFIDSILRGYDVPKVYLRRVDNPPYLWEVIDGQQRLRAIWQFIENRYSLADESDPIDGYPLAGKSFADLDPQIQRLFHAYRLSMVIVEDATTEEIEDMFLRLQNGTPLNAAEKRNAILGQLRHFIHDLAETHKLMTDSVTLPNNRYVYDEIIAQMLCIEINSGPTKLQPAVLKEMYQANRSFREGSQPARKLRRVLNFLANAFPKRTPELTKVNLVSLYTVASDLMASYSIMGREEEFGRWFLDFERKRREDAEEFDAEKFSEYVLAINQQTASVASQRVRQEFLREDLLATIQDLALIDPTRLFTEEQRIAIFRRGGGKCANPANNPDCDIDCEWGNWHADHIVPHSRGGPTSVENGQLLCPSCNLKKAAA